ncbi:hypothetical protein AAG570_011484 [Ranatra chinensis]|uniref:YLPM1-like spectrin repeat domain-containing protein n=1 Tax=Ranatra chinensis TaxID=642074 RepID=A0ABD0Z707_9HEMI
MQAWNQWGAQASGGTTYAGLSGFTTPTVATVPSPAVAAGTPPVAPLQGYPLGGYQWPNYPASAVGTYAGAQWPLGQQTQHWDHWQQWQQQYNQWQQQYGDKLGASGAGLVSQPASSVEGQASIPTSQPSIPMQVTNIQTVSSKRLNDGSGDGSQQEIKKLCMDGTQNSEWSAQKASANKDNLEELSEAEKLFDEQFRNWERQFNAWREQNANHPDTVRICNFTLMLYYPE